MPKRVGKSVKLSPFRRLVTDLMHFSSKVPSVTADRRMDLSPMVEARAQVQPRPTWSAILCKAYGIVAQRYPELRRSYMSFPRPRLYEHPYSVAQFNIERTVGDERIVMYCLIRRPETRSLAEIDAIVRHHKEAPIHELRSYKRAVATSHIPWPFRKIFWWGALNVSGRRRCHNYGTFGLSSIAAHGAGLLHLIPLLTTTIHFNLMDEHHRLDMRLSWDHRVLDGATIGEVLVDFEKTLNTTIVQELHSMRGPRLAA